MRAHLSFEGVGLGDLPFSVADLRRLIRMVTAELLNDELYVETRGILGQKPSSLGLLFCIDTQMREFQKRYRKLDRTTDVLSFPTREMTGPELGQHAHLGDLIVSLAAVQRGALRGRRPIAVELADVLIHGMLHLIGHDHVRGPKRARAMFAVQKRILKKWMLNFKAQAINARHERRHARPRNTPAKPTRNQR